MKKTLKILSTILAIVLVFGTVSVGMSAFAESGDYIGAYDFEITNPYKDITWGNVTAYKSMTHVHTVRSDADTEVDDMINKYYELGFDAMCLTDHGTVNYGWNHAQTRVTIFDYQYFVHGVADQLTDTRYAEIITGSGARSINSGKGMMEIPLGNEINGMSTIKCHINGYYADACHGELNVDADWPRDAVVSNFNAGGFTHINHVGEWAGGNSDPEVYDSSFISDFASIYQNYGACRGGRNTTAQTAWNNAHGEAGCIGMELVNTADSRTHNDRRYVYDEILKILAPQGINVFGFCEDDAHEYEDCDRNAQYFLINNDKIDDVTITATELANSDSSGDADTSDYNNDDSDPMDRAQNCYRDAMYYGEFYCSSKNSKNSYELGDGFVASGDYPSISNISIDSSKNQIIITYKDATKLRVIADGEIIETHRTDAGQQTVAIDLNRNENKINSYVRIYLTGAGGITYLQPFLVKKTASDTSSVQFITPSSDTNIVVKDSSGSVVSDSLKYENNYYLLTPGDYTYTASRRGYQTKEDVPFTVTQAQYDADEQIKINVTLDELTDVSYAYFYVPETIYVSPNDNKTFEKYIDRENAVNGALHAEGQTTGNIYFHREGASNISLTWSVIDGNTILSSMSIGSTSASGDTLATSITAGSTHAALSNDQYVYIKWEIEYSYNGFTYRSYQYTYVYKPKTDTYSTVAAGGIAKTNHVTPGWMHTTMAIQASIYVSGIHKLESSYYQGYAFNPYSGSDPLLGIDDYSNAITTGMGYRYETDISDGAGSSIVRTDNTDGAYIYADRSRIDNWSQIPYLIIGLDLPSTEELTGENGVDECVRFAFDYSMTELENQTAGIPYLYDVEFGGSNTYYYRYIDYDLETDGYDQSTTNPIGCSNGLSDLNGRMYQANNEVAGKKLVKDLPSEDTQEETVNISAYVKGSKESRTDIAVLGVHIHLVNINKSSLRTELNNTVKDCYQQEWFQNINEWNTYQNTISAAGKVLGNPVAEEAEIEEATLALQEAVDNFSLKEGTKKVGYYWKLNGNEGLIYSEADSTYTYGEDLSVSAMEIAGYTYAKEYKLYVDNELKYTYANGYKTDASTGAVTASTEDTYDLAFAEETSYEWKFYYTPNQYDVTYNTMGAGTVSSYTATARFGQNYTVTSEVPEKAGYEFLGWYLDVTQKTYSAGEAFKWNYAGNGEFTAQWSAKTYNVTYDVNDGSTISIADRYKTATYGDAYPICPNYPSKTGYNFDGWQLNGGKIHSAGGSVTWDFTSDGTFVAQWEIANYNVDFVKVAADAYVDGGSITVQYNQPYGTLPKAERTGYTSQWYSTEDYTAGTLVTADTVCKISKNHELYAKYTPIQYSITYNLDGGSLPVSNPSNYNITDTFTLNNPVRTGYEFLGWSGSDISSSAYDKNHVVAVGSTGAKTFNANWELAGYTISYELNGGENNTNNPSSYKSTDTITLYEPTKTGYSFLGWTVTKAYDPLESNPELPQKSVTIPLNSTGDKHFIANWELETYTITYVYNTDKAEPANPTSYTYTTDTFTLINPTKTGYVFNGWNSNNASFNGLSTVTITKGNVTGNLTFTALWKEASAHSITYVLDGGRIEGSKYDSYKTPSSFTISKPVKDGYTFRNWTKKVGTGAVQTLDDGADATIVSTDNGDVVFTAYWTVNTYNISYNLDGGKVVTNATNPTTYNIGSSKITLANPIKPGYTFSGWTGTDLTRATKIVEIPTGSYGDRSYTANWSIDTYTVTYDFNGGADTGLVKSYNATSSTSIGAPVRTGYSFAGWNMEYANLTWTEGTINDSGKFVTASGSYYSSPISLKNGLTYTIESAASGLKFCVYSADGTFIEKTSGSTYTATADRVAFIVADSTTLENIRSTTVDFANGSDDTFDSYSIATGSMGNLSLKANWNDVTYTISYELNGGTIAGGLTNKTSYTYESSAIRLINPEKTGYEFLGWSYNGVVSTSVTIPTHSTGDRTYVATWSKANYSITYNGLDGANDPGNRTTYTIDDTFTLTRPTKENYTFNGWIGTDLTSSTLDVTVPANSTGNREYTATWTPNTYSITYDLNGGTNSSANKNSFTVETETFSLYAPTKTGYTFAGWTGTGLSSSSTTVTIAKGSSGDRTYTANWTIITYNISYDLAGGTETTNPTYYTAADTISLAQPTRTGYEFTGWTETGNETLVKNVTIPEGSTGDKNYLAHWSVNTYTITYTLNGGELSDSAKKSYTVETATFTLETPTKDGYHFAGWTGTDLNSATTTVTIPKGSTGIRAYTATWIEDSYTITYNNVDYDDVTFNAINPTSYTPNSPSFTLSNPLRTGYTFTGWTGTGISGTGISTEVTIAKGSTGDRTYTANWAVAEYTLTYYLDEGGSLLLPNPTTYTYFSAPITLNNAIRPGYVFAGWMSNDSTEVFETYVINTNSTGNKSFTAVLTTADFSISYDLNGGSLQNGLTNPESYSYDTSTFTINNPTKSGYTFVGWSGTGITGTKQTLEIPIHSTGNRSYTANWSAAANIITYDLDGGSIKAGTNPDSYDTNSGTLTIINPTRNGYKFAGWTYDSSNTFVTVNSLNKVAKIDTSVGGSVAFTATWTPINYSITYNLNGGTISDNETSYTVEDQFTIPVPTRAGYTFAGWSGTGLSGYKVENVTVKEGSTGNRTYTANWSEQTYTITYNLNGGTVDNANPVNYTVSTPSFTLNNPTKTGCTFTGWSGTGITGTQTVVTVSTGSTGNRAYTANFDAIEYKITYVDTAGSSFNSSTSKTTYTSLDADFSIPNITKNGYTFLGWKSEDAVNPVKDLVIKTGTTGDKIYTAKWSIINYSITYELDYGTNSELNPSTYNVTSSTITLEDPTKTGYKFDGWSTTDGGTASETVTIPTGTTGDKTYYAIWGTKVYTITYNGCDYDDMNSYTPGKTTYTSEDADFTLVNPVRTGYKFDGWSGTGITGKNSEVTVSSGSSGNRTYTANWTISEYTIKVNLNGGTTSSSIPVTYTIDSDTITLPTPKKTGYVFTGWSGTDIPDTETAMSVQIVHGSYGAKTYTANWTERTGSEHKIYFYGYNDNLLTLPGGLNYEEVTIGQPIPDPINSIENTVGYKITGWDIDLTDSKYVNLNDDIEVHATWEVCDDEYTVIVNGTKSYTETCDQYEKLTIQTEETSASGAKFSYWVAVETDAQGNELSREIVSYYRNYTFFVHADVSLLAVYGNSSSTRASTRISYVEDYDSSYNWFTVYSEKNVATEYTLVQHGLIFTDNSTIGTQDTGTFSVTNDLHASYVNKNSFVIGTTGVRKGASSSNTLTGMWTLSIRNPSRYGETIYIRSFVKVADASGTVTTIYSNVVTYQNDESAK